MKNILIISCALFWAIPLFSQKIDNWTSNRPDGHAPMGVMGDHTHGKGEFMFSYRFMRMQMEGMRSGTESLANEDVLKDFRVTPTEMPMDMHMLSAMYAVSDELTLMAMVNILDNSMDHLTRMGGQFTTESGGLGDVRLSGLYKFLDKNGRRMHANLGVSIPTGSIEEADVTPASKPNETQLPYPMQISSGTWDVLPGVTFLSEKEHTSWGAQLMGTLRLGENERDYRFGNAAQLTLWSAYRLNDWLSTSLRASGKVQSEIEGSDATYAGPVMMSMVPTVFPENFGGTYLFIGGGINLFVPTGALKDIRLGIELELPVVQDLNGVQMETDYLLTTGLQYTF